MEAFKDTHDKKYYYWFFLLTLFIFSLITGIFGFYTYFSQSGAPANWLRIVYCTLQLYAVQGGDLPGTIPWTLEIARFAAAITTALAVVSALFGIFREQWNRLRISMMRNHVIIIGFGTKGKNILQENLKKGKKVVVIDNDPLNPNLSILKSSKCRFLPGDATGKDILHRAAIKKAETVFLMMGDDNHEVNSCMAIYDIIKKEKRFDKDHPLQCIMHLQKNEFLNTMKNHSVVQDINDGLALNIFNIYENSARLLFEEHPPDRNGITAESENYVQMVIFGFGKAGEALALQTALTGHYINGKKPFAVVIDRDAGEKVKNFLTRYPTYSDYCEIEPATMEAESPQLINKIDHYLETENALTTIVLCFDNKTLNMLLGLQILNMKPKKGSDNFPPVFVRTDDEETLKKLSEELIAYALPSKVCSQKIIMGGYIDTLAKTFHTNYLGLRRKEKDFGSRDADVEWESLSQEYKDSNRKAADHMAVKVRSIDCEIVEKNDKRPPAVFTDDEIEKLAELEHRRWNAERSLAGWTYNEVKNNKTRKTPYLTGWTNIPENIREYDRDSVRNIPDIVALMGKKIVRK